MKSLFEHILESTVLSATDKESLAKKYIPYAKSIAAAFKHVKNMDWNSLVSAAYLGLANAINDYKDPDKMKELNKQGQLTFKQYAAYRIQQQILSDIRDYNNTIRLTKYFFDKETKDKDLEDIPLLNMQDIDSLYNNTIDKYDEEEVYDILDTIPEVKLNPRYTSYQREEFLFWKLYQKIKECCSDMDADILFSSLGWYDCKKMKIKELAVRYKVSESAISQRLHKTLKFIKNYKVTKSILQEILEIYEY